MSRILIADDHAVTRAGYKHFLDDVPAVTAVGEAENGNAVLECLKQSHWDLVLLDIHMPGRGGLDILEHIRSGYPATRIIIMSGLPEEQYASNVLRAGASGYVSKGTDAQEMLRAIHTVLSGHRYVSQRLAEQLASDLHDTTGKPLHARLSLREFQIFCKIAQGLMVKQIARETCLSHKTISTYRSRIMDKLHFQSNADMTAYALRNDLIP